MIEKGKESLLSTVFIIWEFLWSIVEDTQDDQRHSYWGEGHTEDFHLITHKHVLTSPTSSTAMLGPVTNHPSLCVSRGQNGGQTSPPLCATPWWDNPGDSQNQRGEM